MERFSYKCSILTKLKHLQSLKISVKMYTMLLEYASKDMAI